MNGGSSLREALRNTSKGKLVYHRNAENIENESDLQINSFFARIGKTLEDISLKESSKDNQDEVDFTRQEDKHQSANTKNRSLSNLKEFSRLKNRPNFNSTYQISSDQIDESYKENHDYEESERERRRKAEIDHLSLAENEFNLKKKEKIDSLVSKLSSQFNEITEESNIKLSEIRQTYFISKLKWLEQFNNEWNTIYDQVTTNKSTKYDSDEIVRSKLEKVERDRIEIQNEIFKRRQKKLKDYYDDLELIYKEIVDKFKSNNIPDNEIQSFKQIKTLKERFELLLQKTTPDNLNENILKEAKQQLLDPVIELNNKQIKQQIDDYLTKTKNQTTVQEATAKTSKQPLPSSKSVQQTKKAVVESDHEGFSSSDHLKEYVRMRKFKMSLEKSIKEFSEQAEFKQYRSNLLLYIKTIVNSISSSSQQHINDKIDRFTRLFSGQNVEFRDQTLSIKNHKDAFHFSIYHAANSFMTTGLKQVLASTKSSYSFAIVIVTLWIKFEDFGKIMHAFFYEMCPYTVPYYPVRDKDDDELTHKVALGYALRKDGSLEEEESFLNSMRALVKLYATIIQTPKPGNPLDLKYGWRWLTSLLSLHPRGSISPAVLHSFLSIADTRLRNVYGKQYVKLVHYIRTVYMPKIHSLQLPNPQAQSQLSTFIEETLKNN